MAMVDKFTLSRQVEEIKGTLIDHWQPKTGVWKSIQKNCGGYDDDARLQRINETLF
jgi:Zn-dependent membrane protease YugP